jgi:4-hydroxy-tetrahydrodipicolinate reductase
MRILLIGYGKMGQAIEAIAVKRGHQIAGRVDVDNRQTFATSTPVDVAIEFTHPDAAVDNIRWALENRWPVVVGTTGWYTHLPGIKTAVEQHHGALLHACNFSLGVNLFFKLNEYLARLMNAHPDYDVVLDETHHTQKKDAPSGTAITLAEGILKEVARKKNWSLEQGHSPEDLVIRSHRVDPVPGTHVVAWTSAVDDIEIKHTAHSRQGFALGAVVAAEWLAGKKGVFTMKDLLDQI